MKCVGILYRKRRGEELVVTEQLETDVLKKKERARKREGYDKYRTLLTL